MIQYRTIEDSQIAYDGDCPYIDIKWESGRIYVSGAVLRLIGNPSGIRFLWSAGKRSLIIEPTDIDDSSGCYPVIGATYAKRRSLFIGSTTLMKKIWETIDWDKTLRFRIVARYNVRANIAIFELRDACAFQIQRNARGDRHKRSE